MNSTKPTIFVLVHIDFVVLDYVQDAHWFSEAYNQRRIDWNRILCF